MSRFVSIVLAASILAPLGAELVYRAVFRWRLAALERALEEAHAGETGVEYVRFGRRTSALRVSLVADAVAAARRSRRWGSALDAYDPGLGVCHGFAGMDFSTRSTGHAFYWSPRRMDFYHAANWGEPCSARTCDWRRDPQLAGFPPSFPDP